MRSSALNGLAAAGMALCLGGQAVAYHESELHPDIKRMLQMVEKTGEDFCPKEPASCQLAEVMRKLGDDMAQAYRRCLAGDANACTNYQRAESTLIGMVERVTGMSGDGIGRSPIPGQGSRSAAPASRAPLPAPSPAPPAPAMPRRAAPNTLEGQIQAC